MYTNSMFESEDVEDPGYIGTSLQRQFSKGLSEMLKGGSSSDTEAMQVQRRAHQMAAAFVHGHWLTALSNTARRPPGRLCTTLRHVTSITSLSDFR
jgi:hypothetical protein